MDDDETATEGPESAGASSELKNEAPSMRVKCRAPRIPPLPARPSGEELRQYLFGGSDEPRDEDSENGKAED